MEFRIEKDTMGDVKVPAEKYWGAQTQRSIEKLELVLQSSSVQLTCGIPG